MRNLPFRTTLGFALCLSSLAVAQTPPPAVEDGDSLYDRLDELEERLDQVEKRTLLDRVQLTGDYRTIFNAVMYKGPTSDPYDPDPMNPANGRQIEQTNAEIWSHRLRLSVLAEPVSSVRVSARLVMYKLFGDQDSAPFVQDSVNSRLPRDSGARFDQAWIDWFITEWLALSAGRIAYSEGNPGELKENSRVRRATWGMHMVDGEYDSINMTFNMGALMDDLYVRLFYASWFNDDDKDVFGGFPFLTSGTDNLRILGANLDIKIPGLGRNFMQLGYYVVPKFRPFFVPIPDPGFDPSQDFTNTPAPLNGSLLFPTDSPDSLGAYQNVSGLIEFYDIGHIGLDMFLSGSIGFLEPNGKGIAYDIPSNIQDPNSPRTRFPFLFLASQGDSGTTYFVYGGLRYTLPIKALNLPKLGFEYNYGSKYHISFAVQQDNLLTKLATRGSAYEGYLILPINKSLFLRGSYLFIDSKYGGGFFGPNPAAFGSTAPARPQQTHSFNVTLSATL